MVKVLSVNWGPWADHRHVVFGNRCGEGEEGIQRAAGPSVDLPPQEGVGENRGLLPRGCRLGRDRDTAGFRADVRAPKPRKCIRRGPFTGKIVFQGLTRLAGSIAIVGIVLAWFQGAAPRNS